MSRRLSRNSGAVQITDPIVNRLLLMMLLMSAPVSAAAPVKAAKPAPAAPAKAVKLAAPRLPPPRFAFEVLGHNVPLGFVALTFDDGPHRTLTPALLELLAKHQAPATFFMLGQNARVLPGVAQAVAAAGHAIGAHSMDHKKLTGMSDEQLTDEVAGSQKLVSEAIGRPVTLFRAPYGARDAHVIRAIDAAHMRHVLWSIDSRDWAVHDPERTAQAVLAGILEHHRGIVLMHDIHPTSIQAAARLLDLLEPLRRSGAIHLVTMDQLLGFQPMVLTAR